MVARQLKIVGSTFVATLSLSGLLLVAGCDQRPYPTVEKPYAEATEAPPPAALAGAPVAPSPPPAPVYDAPPPPARAYDAPAIVAMAPIPNPGDPGSEGYYPSSSHDRRVHTHLYASAPPVYAAPRPAPAPRAAAKSDYAKASPPPVVKPYTPPKDYKPAPPPAAAVAPPKTDQAKAAPPPKPTPATSAVPPAPVGDRAAHIAALTAALTDSVSKSAVLAAPERFTANQPADVTLTLAASLADTLRAEAQKDRLADAAASVNMTAILSGDGFSVTPDQTQSQPLTAGQPTEFRWTVTAQPGAKGPLHADVGADLLGSGSDTLALGSVQKQAGPGVKPTPRMIGAAILVLFLALVVVWLARGRTPSRSATARKAARAARTDRPLDMGGGPASS